MKRKTLLGAIALFTLTGCFVGCSKKTEDPKITLSSIEISSDAKTTYNFGEEFVKPVITATYSDFSKKDVTANTIFTGFDSEIPGEQMVKASYTESSGTKEQSYKVTIGDPKSNLRFAVFADVQLCAASSGDNKAANLGATANAPIALKNHFEFIKKNNIDVVLMNGDITNQANEEYYKYFYEILDTVYESKNDYPEFIWNMGNHEWWWGTTEKETGDAVSMFKKYARIDSDNLKGESYTPYAINPSVSVPSYYKVIKGVPFIVISAENSSGKISNQLRTEIQGWLTNIKKLPSVKKGGPIFVQYHYPLSTTFTHGQASSTTDGTQDVVDSLFKDTPNAIIYTGDTHFPGVNERAINQVDYTTINIGSSSYSRMVEQSAVLCKDYYNVSGTSGKQADKLTGNAKFKEAYTPTIEIVDVSQDNSLTIDRYFSEEGGEGKHVGKQWKINPIKSKLDFTYTNDRFQKTSSAQDLYGKDGLEWENTDTVKFGVNKTLNQMTVKFPDVTDHHYVEHYQIKVNGTKTYDVVSTYYRNQDNRENNYYILNDIPSADSYSIEVTAFDFFDNPSTNKLTSSNPSDSDCIDPIDAQITNTYTDIQTRDNVVDVASNSNSSVEYYYRGIQSYKYGAILNRLIYTSGDDCSKYLSIGDGTNIKPVITLEAKNIGKTDVKIGITVVSKQDDGKEKWHSDFNVEYQKEVKANTGWTKYTWDLRSLFNLTDKSKLIHIGIKAKPVGEVSAGIYEMNLLLDNIDILGEQPDRELMRFTAGKGFQALVPVTSATDGKLTIDFKFDEPTGTKDTIGIALMQDVNDWNNYLGYYDINKNGCSTTGISSSITADGFTRIVFDFANMDVKQITHVSWIYLRDIYCHVSGVLEIEPTVAKSTRGQIFATAENASWEDKNHPFALTDVVTIDFRFTSQSDTYINVMFGDGWSSYYGYYAIKPTTRTGEFNGITVTVLSDGYLRFKFDLAVLATGPVKGILNKVDLIHIRGGWSNASGYFDVSPTV